MSKAVSVKIPLGLDRQVRIWAAQMDLNRSEFIRQVLEEKVGQLARPATEDVLSGQNTRPIADVSEASAADRAGDTSSSEGVDGAMLESIT